jgi:hypothetical protein
MRTVAALYVERDGIYANMPGVELWDEVRDARLYPGPHPVVAHPPCNRWCQLAPLNQSIHGYQIGDDGGCFAAALESVRRFGGVLEHPAWTLAWPAFGLPAPPAFGWQRSFDGSWVCEVSQAAYGHECRKLTWLYYVGEAPPAPAIWARPKAAKAISMLTNGGTPASVERVTGKDALKTPPAFAEYLIALARESRLEVANDEPSLLEAS